MNKKLPKNIEEKALSLLNDLQDLVDKGYLPPHDTLKAAFCFKSEGTELHLVIKPLNWLMPSEGSGVL